MLLPFAGAGLIAYLIAPAVERLHRLQIRGRAVPRWVAVLLIYAVFFLGLYLFFVSLLPQIYGELVRITKAGLGFANSLTPDRVEEIALTAEAWMLERGVNVALARRSLGMDETALQVDLQSLIEHLVSQGAATLQSNVGDIVDVTRSVIGRLVAGVFSLFFILMVAAFFSIDAAGGSRATPRASCPARP